MSKTIHIVACGESGRLWPGIGISIGVNDAEKFGKRCTYLANFNHPSKFRNEPDRMKTILAGRPEKFFTHAASWRHHFTTVELIKTHEYNRRAKKGMYYHKRTTPIVAICIAWAMGATEIVLWGVDMVNHKSYRPGMKYFDRELKAYVDLCGEIRKQGVNVCVGAAGSVLCAHLPMWEPAEFYHEKTARTGINMMSEKIVSE